MKHRVTNHDITKLRVLAARGVYITPAARDVGLTDFAVRYWNNKLHLGLIGHEQKIRLDSAHPAPDIIACWRLHQTMQRIIKFREGLT